MIPLLKFLQGFGTVMVIAILFVLWRYHQFQNPPLTCHLFGGNFSWIWGWSCG